MSFRPTNQLIRARPKGRLLHAKPLDPSICSVVPLSTHIGVPDVRTYASAQVQPSPAAPPAVQEQPPSPVLDSSDPEDETIIAEFISSIQQCRTAEQLQKLADGRDFNSRNGSLELGNVIRKLRQIEDKARSPWGKQGGSHEFARHLCHETKKSMAAMLPRTIANSLHYLNALASLDKNLLAKASSVVTQKVEEAPTAFKIIEIAQICKACSRLKFTNSKLNKALSINIMSLTDAELNPRAVLSILSACNRMGFSDAEVARCLIGYLEKNVGMLEVYELGRVCLPATRNMENCPKESAELFQALQNVVCRQKPKSITAMTAAILLRDLARPGVLQPEAAQVLISIVQREKTIGQSLGAALHQAQPALEEMGYQVNVQTSFSDLSAKGSDKSESTVEA